MLKMVNCQRNMRGVDLMDQVISYYVHDEPPMEEVVAPVLLQHDAVGAQCLHRGH